MDDFPRPSSMPKSKKALRRLLFMGLLILLATSLIGVAFKWRPAGFHLMSTAAGSLSLLWSYKAGGVVDESRPIVTNGTLYLANGDLWAFDAGCHSTCQPLWHYTPDIGFRTTPAVVDHILYLVSESGTLRSRSLKLYAFDTRCRSACLPLWVTPVIKKGPQGRDIATFFLPTPVIAGGMLYLAFTLELVDRYLSYGELYVFDTHCRQHCQPLWTWEEPGMHLGAPPAVSGGMVYIGSADPIRDVNDLSAFDAACRDNCHPLWTFQSLPLDQSNTYLQFDGMVPAVAGGLVYVSTDTPLLYVFDATCHSACHPLWSWDFRSSNGGLALDISAPVITRDMAYIDVDDALYAFDAHCRSRCQPLWHYSKEGGGGPATPVAEAGNVVYVIRDFHLFAFDAGCRANCQPQAQYELPVAPSIATTAATPVAVDGIVYAHFYGQQGDDLLARGGRLFAFRFKR